MKRPLALTSALVAALLLTPVPGAAAATTAGGSWAMQETSGTTMQEASGGVAGTIGTKVFPGYDIGDGRFGYLFVEPRKGADRQHLVEVPDDGNVLDPGTRDMDIEVVIATRDVDANVVGKGQNGMSGGRYKFELSGGYPLCVFEGDAGSVRAKGPARIDDGRLHTVLCEKRGDRLRTIVDGVVVKQNRGVTGRIATWMPLALGGKRSCNGKSIPCDYFTGVLAGVSVRIL